MSLLNDASLILVPSAIKTGEVLVQKPLPNKFADETGNYDGNDPQGSANLTFTRASSATRVGPDGLIEKVRTNLLTQSEEFTTSNGWFAGVTGGSTATQTSNYGIAPNGTTTADRIQLALNGEPYADWVRPVSGFVIGQSYTYSIYLKSLTGSTNLEFFNDGASNVLKTITTEWVRYSHSFTASSATIYPRFLLGVTTSSTADLLAWGYQLETGDIATDYIPTTTTAVSVGPVANLPRLNYPINSDGSVGCPSLLLEPQRTNLALYSEQFDNAAWTKTNTTITANATTSPDGYANADKLVEDTSTGTHQIQKILTVSAATVYTTSVFVKYAGREWIRFTDAQSSNRIHFNTLTGVFGTTSGTVIDYNSTTLGDGWYKLSLTTTSVGTAYTPRITLAEADNDITYTGDGTSGVYIYGAQLEAGAYATSYIPTLGAAVTRGGDACSKTGISSLIGQTEGTIYLEADIQKRNEADFYVALSAGSVLGDAIYLYQPSSGNLQLLIRKTGNADGTISILSANWTAGLNKVAIAYTATTAEVFINGVTKGTTSFVSAPACSQLTIGSRPDVLGTLVDAGPYNQALLFKTRLTNQELQDLTTL